MPNSLPQLPNLGPKSQVMLEGAGITTVAMLRELGAVRAYVRVTQSGGKPGLNLLWALEGALSSRWRVSSAPVCCWHWSRRWRKVLKILA